MTAPLEGVRVLDLTTALTPAAAMILGDLGADVIKVEQPSGASFNRAVSVSAEGGKKESSLAISIERNKRGLTLDWHTARGREVLLRLARECDIVIENYGPGNVERHGIGYDDVRRENPAIIYCSVSAYGRTGPLAHKKAIDLNVQGYAGHMAITGDLGGPPVKCGPPVGDFPAVWLAVVGILAALRERDRSGEGQRVDVSLLDAALLASQPREQEFWMAGRSTERLGTRHVSVVPHQAFETGDGRYVTVAVTRDEVWRRFCDAIGAPELGREERFATVVARYERREELIPRLEAIFRGRPLDHWLRVLDEASIMSGPILTTEEALSHDQVRHNEMIVEVDHPRAGRVKLLGIPIKLSRTPLSIRRTPPALGQHTDEILRAAGFDAREIADLRAGGVV